MRLILTIHDTPVIDLELRWPSRTDQQDEQPQLEASGGGQVERAEQYGDPATIAGFGFVRRDATR